jgi:aspartate aminotransferase-like enzyme
MLNFTVGPVMSESGVLEFGAQSTPYFRTSEFSQLMLQSEALALKALEAPPHSRCVFLTTSGTGAMETLVMHVLNARDKVLVVNGGGFGERFAELCRLHGREMSEIRLSFGSSLREEDLEPFARQGYTALLVNMCETSSGVLYDMPLIARFCKRNGFCCWWTPSARLLRMS